MSEHDNQDTATTEEGSANEYEVQVTISKAYAYRVRAATEERAEALALAHGRGGQGEANEDAGEWVDEGDGHALDLAEVTVDDVTLLDPTEADQA